MSKTRLTITLSEDILKKVDQLIDRKTIRNRSHAIEHLVTRSLEPSISTAIILAGANTANLVRPLTEIQGQPLILNALNHLKSFGVTNIIITTDQYGEAIEKLLGDGAAYDVSIKYLYEKKPLGTAGAVKNAASLLQEESFYVWSGDVLTDINLHDLSQFHHKHDSIVTFAVKPRPTKSSYDNVFLQGPNVVDFQPSSKDQEVGVVNTGIYVFSPEIFSYLPPSPSMLEKDVFPKLTRAGKCVAFMFQGVWFDIGTDQNYKEFHHYKS